MGAVAEAAKALKIKAACCFPREHSFGGGGHLGELMVLQMAQQPPEARLARRQELGDRLAPRAREGEGDASSGRCPPFDPALAFETLDES
jgi:hypothetical protein